MTADDEDDGLKSLRSVWLSMPDEDPPERGLADLMAAARVKAETMATPSLWQRFVDLMRRPPVFALATVMVLIGGAVLVGNHSKGMDAQPTISATDEEPGAARSAGSASAETAPSTTLAPDAVGGAAPQVEAPAAEAKPTTPAPMKRPEPRGKDLAKEKSAMPSMPKGELNESPKNAAKLDQARDEDALRESDGEAEKKVDAKATSTETRHAGAGTGAAQATAPSDSAALATAAPSSAAELHQMAKKLVARGDCKSAHALTDRIAKQDPAYYKAKIVPDHAFDRCVLAQ